MPMDVENLEIVQHWYTLHYATIWEGGYRSPIRRFKWGDYVYLQQTTSIMLDVIRRCVIFPFTFFQDVHSWPLCPLWWFIWFSWAFANVFLFFNPKKFQLLFLGPRDVSSNPWCEIMEKTLKGKGGGGGERGQIQMASLSKGLNLNLIFFFYF